MTESEENKQITTGYIGTYASPESKGVYRFFFDRESGALTEPRLFYEAPDAKWISLQGNRLVFPVKRERGAGVCFLDIEGQQAGRAWELLEETQTPCYILQDGTFAYTANYHDGTVMVYDTEKEKPVLAAEIENGREAGCHQVLVHEDLLLVPCLEQDLIRLFDRGKGFALSGEIPFPKGTGPRHGVFNRAHTRLYVVSERSNELFCFQVQGREFTLYKSLPLLPEGENGGAAAAVRLTGDGSFLYLSVRGPDLLVCLDVRGEEPALVQYTKSGGIHPRDFILSQDERFLLAANRQEGGLVCWERDGKSGRIRSEVSRIKQPECVALALEPAFEN